MPEQDGRGSGGDLVLSERNVIPRDTETFPKTDRLQQFTTLAGPEKVSCCPFHLPCSISFFAWTHWSQTSCSGITTSSEGTPRKNTEGAVLQPKQLKTESGANVQVKTGQHAGRASPGPLPPLRQGRSRQTTLLIMVARLKVTVTAITVASGRLPTLLQAR